MSKVFASGNTIGPLLVGFVAQDSICWAKQTCVLCANGKLHGPRVLRNDLVALGQQLSVSRGFPMFVAAAHSMAIVVRRSCHIFKRGAGCFPL